MDCFLIILSYLEKISIIFASIVAIWGIKKWHNEYIGKKKIDIAEEVLSVFYEIEGAFKHIRSPFVSPNEENNIDIDDNFNHVVKISNIALNRYNNHKDLFSKFYKLKSKFKIYFEEENHKVFKELDECIIELLVAIEDIRFYENIRKEMRGKTKIEYSEEENNYLKDYNIIISNSKDDFKAKINSIVSETEKLCKKIISKGK
jgi:hypothetical protein